MAPSGWWQRFSLACHCFSQYPSSPGFLCCFARGFGCATLLCLWLCAHLLSGLGFPILPDYPSPFIRLWVYWFQWLLFSTRVPFLRDGATPAGSRFVCPRSKRRFSVPVWVRSTGQFMVGPHASFFGVSARPVPSDVLPDGPRCVRELRLSLAPFSVLPCPMLGFRAASATLAEGLGLSWVLCPSAGGGFVPRLVARLGPHWIWGSWEVLGSLHCAPLAVGLLPGPPTLLCLLSAGCFLGLQPSPSGEASASAWRFSWCPVAAGALAVVLPAAASRRGFFPLWLVLPLQGSVTFLAFVPQLEALSESPTLSIPRSFLVVALSASAVGFADTLWLCPERALSRFLCVGLVDRSRRIVAPLAPCLCWRFLSLVCVLLMRWGVSPGVWFRRGPWGVAVAPPISPYTGPGWSPPICRVALELRSVFPIFLCDIPHVSMAIILSVSLTPACPYLVFTIGCSSVVAWLDEWLGCLSVPLLALPGFCHLRGLIVPTVWSWCILR